MNDRHYLLQLWHVVRAEATLVHEVRFTKGHPADALSYAKRCMARRTGVTHYSLWENVRSGEVMHRYPVAGML